MLQPMRPWSALNTSYTCCLLSGAPLCLGILGISGGGPDGFPTLRLIAPGNVLPLPGGPQFLPSAGAGAAAGAAGAFGPGGRGCIGGGFPGSVPFGPIAGLGPV